MVKNFGDPDEACTQCVMFKTCLGSNSLSRYLKHQGLCPADQDPAQLTLGHSTPVP